MRDELPKFPTPLEAFGKPAHPPVSAYAPVNNIPKPPQPRYRQVSSGGEYHSTPSLPEKIHSSRPHSAGLQGSHQYTTSQPNLPQQRHPQPPHTRPMQRVPPQKTPQRVPVPSLQSAPPQNQIPQNQPRSMQQPQQQRMRVQPQVPPKVPAQAYAPLPQQQVPTQVYAQAPVQQVPVQQIPVQQAPVQPAPVQQAPVQPAPSQQPVQYQYGNTNRYPESTPMMSSTNGSGRSTPDSMDKVDLRGLFDDVDRHKRGYLTERELSKALVNGDYTLFDAHTVRLMMKMFDRDGDGCIYFAEFGQLWKYLHDWRGVFDRFDTSKSESISYEEFSHALNAFGYSLSKGCVEFMFNAGSKLNRQGQREMSFDMFVQSCISIKSITDTFKKYDTDRDGYVTMGFEDFLMETTKLH